MMDVFMFVLLVSIETLSGHGCNDAVMQTI
jgi:hypothetical protein